MGSVKDPFADDWDPIELGLLLAKLEYEDLDISAQLKNFEDLKAIVLEDFPSNGSIKEQVTHVCQVFAHRLGFQGDKVNYYNIRNSYLNDVMARRKGIPISLSLILMGLLRGVGLKAVGISFPGHFLVRVLASKGHFEKSTKCEMVEDWREQWFIDAFDGGSFMTTQDCEKRLKEWTRGVIPFGPDVLKVAHPTDILARVLRNLKAIFTEKEDLTRLYWVLTALVELCPQEKWEALKDRGLMFARMGRYTQSTKDLREYLVGCMDPVQRIHVENLIRLFAGRTEVIN